MTASQQAKATGLKSLNQMSELSGVKIRTLQNWHKTNQVLFSVILNGCVSKLNAKSK